MSFNQLALKKVRAKGLEPIRTKALDPKSSLATNYNTPAKLSGKKSDEGPRCEKSTFGSYRKSDPERTANIVVISESAKD